MRAQDLISLINTIDYINSDLREAFGDENVRFFVVRSDGDFASVDFLGNELWDSENDDREWNEQTQSYESFEHYFRSAVTEWIIQLARCNKNFVIFPTDKTAVEKTNDKV